MPTLKEIQEQLKALGTWNTFGTKKEIKSLPDVLSDNEQIKYLTSGWMDGNTWLITCTDKRVIFLDKGLVYGMKQVEIPLEKINSITQKTGLMFGEMHIWDGASKMQIRNVAKTTVKPFVDAVNQAIEDNKKQNAAPQQQSIDIAGQLEKLAGLKEKGILSEEEFQAQKQKLLDQ